MMNESRYHSRMHAWKAASLLIAAWGSWSCAQPNPLFCSEDKICMDPGHPYCDLGGELSGIRNNCIAVDCTPGQVALCRGDVAVTCDAHGNNYDDVDCMLGCDMNAGGCVGCLVDTDCSDADPVCDAGTRSCRACRTDAECGSEVCDIDHGTCAAAGSVAYVSPTGSASSECTQSDPCTLTHALAVATSAVSPPIVRLRAGTYTSPIQVQTALSQPLEIVATGASISPGTTAVVATGGANVALRGGTLTTAKTVQCGTASLPMSTLALRDVSLSVDAASGNAFDLQNCNLSVSNADVALKQAEIAASASGNVTLTADRLHFHGDPGFLLHVVVSGANDNLRFTNSLIENASFDVTTTDTSEPGSSLVLSFTTLALTDDSLACDQSIPNFSLVADNAIVAGLGSSDAIRGATCTLTNTIAFPQAVQPPGGIVLDPMFSNAATRDFHLRSGSPAIDAATATGTTDLDGTSRPQGPKSDLGAYELKP
jgi:hypothetical protein